MQTQTEVKLVEWFDDHWYKINYQAVDAAGNETEVTTYFPSVTTKLGVIAKPFIAKWRGDIGNREADLRMFESSERGVRIHHGWYTLTTQGIVLYQPPQRPNYQQSEIDGFIDEFMGNVAIIRYQDEMYDLVKLTKWLNIVKPITCASELIVYSIANKDAGTTDNVFDIEEGEYAINGSKPLNLPKGRYVADLKTGNVVDDDAFMQIACYAKCYEEMGLGEITGGLIIHTGAKTRTAIEGLATLYRTREQLEEDCKDYRLASALWERKNANAKPKVFEFPTLLTYFKEKP